MVVVSMLTAAAAAKWVLAAKVMIAVGGGLVTAGPALDKMAAEKRKENARKKGENNYEYV